MMLRMRRLSGTNMSTPFNIIFQISVMMLKEKHSHYWKDVQIIGLLHTNAGFPLLVGITYSSGMPASGQQRETQLSGLVDVVIWIGLIQKKTPPNIPEPMPGAKSGLRR